ncbi:DUF1456 family protein [Thalassotalea sp. ND16A]|uniref:DUF1456 family protein n=1 Tax=Thalassotalea sp. ND16A TaxID=1535422 RepID=UPI000519EF70|nr:DUF1456 family protein [Thalassotalea sp. ND16A]KGK00799.1 hypothetical protein ND16A_3270 [Thalassotalea sp. ND16A]
MTNNDIIRRIRFIFNYDDSTMLSIFSQAELTVELEQYHHWLRKEDDPKYINLTDVQLATFLNGLINKNRGKREGPQPKAESKLNNNLILRKLKIALNLNDTDMIEILALTEIRVGKAEISAFFRKVGHKHYRECKDQFLRNLLKGMQIKYRENNPWAAS